MSTGMRSLEGLELRTQHIDLERSAIVVRESMGNKDYLAVRGRSDSRLLTLGSGSSVVTLAKPFSAEPSRWV
jgi:hypothetical protein